VKVKPVISHQQLIALAHKLGITATRPFPSTATLTNKEGRALLRAHFMARRDIAGLVDALRRVHDGYCLACERHDRAPELAPPCEISTILATLAKRWELHPVPTAARDDDPK
jgi:hypothetical protein